MKLLSRGAFEPRREGGRRGSGKRIGGGGAGAGEAAKSVGRFGNRPGATAWHVGGEGRFGKGGDDPLVTRLPRTPLCLSSALYSPRKRLPREAESPETAQNVTTPNTVEVIRLLARGGRGLDVIRKKAWPFYRLSSGVRLCWELEGPEGPNGATAPRDNSLAEYRGTSL